MAYDTSADYTAVVSACRTALARGDSIRGEDLRKVIDVVQHAANTLDSKALAAVTALSGALVTALAAWNAVGAGDSSATYTAQEAILTPLRTAALTAAAASRTDITADNSVDGRSA